MLLHLRIKAHFRYSLSLTANEQRHKEARPSITRKSFFFDVCFAEQFHFLSTFGFREATPQPDNSDDRARLSR